MTLKLPDARYTADLEWCGHETPMHVPRFCGEWLRDSVLWPDRPGNQAPAFVNEQSAISACIMYETERKRLIREGLKSQANPVYYP